jgi:hypothetical protein
MARRNETEEQKRKRLLIEEFLKESPVKDFSDIQELMKEMMKQVIESGLAAQTHDKVNAQLYLNHSYLLSEQMNIPVRRSRLSGPMETASPE